MRCLVMKVLKHLGYRSVVGDMLRDYNINCGGDGGGCGGSGSVRDCS